MHDSLTLRIYDWNHRLHVTVDRVGPVADRRHARRTRLWSDQVLVAGEVTEEEASLWAVAVLAGRLGLRVSRADAGGSRHPLEGVTGVGDTPESIQRHAESTLYTQETATTPLGGCGGVAVSDGLSPAGEQLTAF